MKSVFHRHKPVPILKRPCGNGQIRAERKRRFAILLNSEKLKGKMVS